MDSFEASAQFSQILRTLVPSLPSLTKAAHFALKNAESEDFLFPSMMDILNDNTVEINTKSTIFQFIEVLINESFAVSQQSKSHYSFPYIQNLKQSLPAIIYSVLPDANNANLFNVYQSLKSISKVFKINCDEYDKKFNSNLIDSDDLVNLDKDIPFPKIELGDIVVEENDSLIAAWSLLISKKKQSQYERLRLLKHSKMIQEPVDEDQMFALKDKNDESKDLLSKKQILMRMEDDREVHKRSKETLWMVNRPKESSFITENEFLEYYWKKHHKLNPEEDQALLESLDVLNETVAKSYKDKQF
ncbi:uncharacterized protein PRCAT00004712001 [Priceomyces carsonii]|uniref:uncharacterized protein n=1 Tax=Priceomyces carsonii TaxID=28549 RepID=UPI002ED8CE89|nr:unnamed protein product [Priceomyces carsonii]